MLDAHKVVIVPYELIVILAFIGCNLKLFHLNLFHLPIEFFNVCSEYYS